MSRDKAAQYASSLQRNISLYFPFLAYYQISYYKSELFDATAIGRLVQIGFPAELEESLGDSLSGAQLTFKALVSTALIAADPDGLSPRSSWLIANSQADDWLSDASFLGLEQLSTLPGGAELFWLLDRLQCTSIVDIVLQPHQFWMGADNVGMRNDVKINYQLFVFPYRELVSDFVRARKVPYCNESILRVVQTLARRLHRTRASAVHVVEIGANLGDCSVWLAKRMQAVPGLRRIKVLALEAVPAAAAVFQKSVEWNNLTDVIQVVNVAAGQLRGAVNLQAKPMSSNSYTVAEGSSPDFATMETRALDDITPFSNINLIVSHTNGQELSILRGAMRILRKSPQIIIVLQLYGPESGVIRDPTYDPCRPVRWLVHRGFEIYLSHRKGLRLEAPGVLRRYFAEGQQVVNVIAVRKHWRRLLSEPPVMQKPRTCLDLSKGERPNSWAEVDGRVLRENLHIVRIYLETHFAEAPPIGAVLKANAYGHGAVLAGRVLASAKIDALFVSEVETGLILRMAPEVPMFLPMILLYRSPGMATMCKLASANITVSVLSMAWLQQALRWPSCSSKVRLHIMVDTGLNREGLAAQEVAEAATMVLQKWPGWSLDGVYTHWCCVYDPVEMHRSLAVFEHALGLVQEVRKTFGGDAGNQPLTVHTSSSSSILFGVHYDLLRIGGLLFGDPVAISDGAGGTMRLPGPHRTLLWKSKITTMRWSVPGERFSRCTANYGCERGPVFEKRMLLGTIPVGAYEFSDSNIVSSHFREKLNLIEKSTDAILVEIPSTSRTFHQAFEGMEVLLCAESCVQGLFNVPEHVPRILVQDPTGPQYAPSGDNFYPVELNGAIFDSFNLRVVFERDKTGFEESKEFPIRTNTVVAARYQIIEYLGSAAFSRAVQCLDLDTNKMVCMKIIKNDKDFFDQSLDEIKLLKYINVNGNVDHNHVLRLYDHFYHKEHLIIVTELLRDNLYEFSKYNRECGDEPYFTMGRLQKISKQILTALEYVHSLRLIHCDLKPENILIKSYSRCEVKVIDFGSSCFVDDHLSSYVQSRSYRAPEVMLGLPYDQKIDLWSLGCIIAELWTGSCTKKLKGSLAQNVDVPKKTSLRQRMRIILNEISSSCPTRIPDFTEDAEMLSWAGVGLGEAESFQVMCSLRNLAAKEKDGLNKLRFWGKVLGTEADYYVAEAQRDGGGDEPDPDADQPGQGANQFTYYVTNDLAGEWRKLPDIKPNQIVAARAIKRLLTGNAGSKVITHPFFDGKEEVYLRAQIARIAADTVLCPKGFLKKEDEESPVEQNEEFVCPPSSDLQKKE
ncbi:Probable serine/threonine-protein kinase dyrk2 (Dual specificity tyrosine-phosphorylation-regulated kinase 2), partial [Durusdinium trenchii]